MKTKSQRSKAGRKRALWTPALVKGWLEHCPKSDGRDVFSVKGWLVDGEIYCAECVHRLAENNVTSPKATRVLWEMDCKKTCPGCGVPYKPKPSPAVLLHDKFNRLSFPSLTQGADKLTDGKELAGQLSIMRRHDPTVTVPPFIGTRLEKAIVERDTKFLKDFREASKQQDPLRDVYLWMLRNISRIEACRSKGEIFRLVKKQFPKRHIGERYFYKTLAAVGWPLSKPSK